MTDNQKTIWAAIFAASIVADRDKQIHLSVAMEAAISLAGNTVMHLKEEGRHYRSKKKGLEILLGEILSPL